MREPCACGAPLARLCGRTFPLPTLAIKQETFVILSVVVVLLLLLLLPVVLLVLVLLFVLLLLLHLLYLALLVALVVVVVFRSPFYRSSLSVQQRWRYLFGLSPPPRPQYVRPAPGSASASGGRVRAGSQAPGPASAEEYAGSKQMRQRFAYSGNSTAGCWRCSSFSSSASWTPSC